MCRVKLIYLTPPSYLLLMAHAYSPRLIFLLFPPLFLPLVIAAISPPPPFPPFSHCCPPNFAQVIYAYFGPGTDQSDLDLMHRTVNDLNI